MASEWAGQFTLVYIWTSKLTVDRGLPPAKPRKLYSRDKPGRSPRTPSGCIKLTLLAKELEARVVGAPANAFPSPATARVKAYQHCVPSRVQNDASPNDGAFFFRHTTWFSADYGVSRPLIRR